MTRSFRFWCLLAALALRPALASADGNPFRNEPVERPEVPYCFTCDGSPLPPFRSADALQRGYKHVFDDLYEVIATASKNIVDDPDEFDDAVQTLTKGAPQWIRTMNEVLPPPAFEAVTESTKRFLATMARETDPSARRRTAYEFNFELADYRGKLAKQPGPSVGSFVAFRPGPATAASTCGAPFTLEELSFAERRPNSPYQLLLASTDDSALIFVYTWTTARDAKTRLQCARPIMMRGEHQLWIPKTHRATIWIEDGIRSIEILPRQ